METRAAQHRGEPLRVVGHGAVDLARTAGPRRDEKGRQMVRRRERQECGEGISEPGVLHQQRSAAAGEQLSAEYPDTFFLLGYREEGNRWPVGNIREHARRRAARNVGQELQIELPNAFEQCGRRSEGWFGHRFSPHRIANGSGDFSAVPIQTVFVSRYSSTARKPFSRPKPLAPRPPKGAMKLSAR